MKKFSLDNFKDYFDCGILHRGKQYFEEKRIEDIWYQDNIITAYISGNEYYKVILEIEEDSISYSHCTCPYNEDGEYFCKHIACVIYHLSENEIPLLEYKPTEVIKTKSKKTKEDLTEIKKNIEFEIKGISDKHGFIDYYHGRYFVNLIYKICENNFNGFILENKYDEAFELIKYLYDLIGDTFMDGSNGEFQESLGIICDYASKLFEKAKYYDKFFEYAENMLLDQKLNDFSDAPLWALTLAVDNKTTATNIIGLLDGVEEIHGIFVDPITTKINLTYQYVDKTEAIKMAYDNLSHYYVKDILIDYLKKDGKINEIIRILKDDIENHIRKDMAYDKLISIYDEYNMPEEKKKILPDCIIETCSIRRYKELKNMYTGDEWDSIKEDIYSKIETNKHEILEQIYEEENEINELFSSVKQKPHLGKLSRYQNTLKEKYSNELLEYYKPQILDEAKRVSDRSRYQELCKYIAKMGELNNSDDFIFEMLKEMYESYKSKRAFKEEINRVLSNKNKVRFQDLIK